MSRPTKIIPSDKPTEMRTTGSRNLTSPAELVAAAALSKRRNIAGPCQFFCDTRNSSPQITQRLEPSKEAQLLRHDWSDQTRVRDFSSQRICNYVVFRHPDTIGANLLRAGF